jgi:DNA-binding PadR family transcriptional regulator
MIQDLDSKAKLILEAIYQNGGEADTSDIKSYTGIEKSGVVHYRLDEKLEPDGYVETRKVDRDGSALGVKMSELTSKGRNAVGEILDEDSATNLSERVEALRREVERLDDLVMRYEGRVEEAQEATEELTRFDQRLEKLEFRFDQVEERADTVEEIRTELEVETERLVEEEISNRQFVGVDLAHLLHEADIVSAPQTGENRANSWDALTGLYPPENRSVGAGARLKGFIDQEPQETVEGTEEPQETVEGIEELIESDGFEELLRLAQEDRLGDLIELAEAVEGIESGGSFDLGSLLERGESFLDRSSESEPEPEPVDQ